MPVALDTETTLATDAEPAPRLVSVAFAWDGGQLLSVPSRALLRADVINAFDEGVIMANAPFDVHVLLRQWPDLLPAILDAYWNDRIYDVLTREKLIDIALGQHFKLGKYNLGAVALRRADIELNKEDDYRKNYEALLGLPLEAWPEDAKRYAIDDVVATYEVWQAQEHAREGLFTLEEAGRQARKHIALYSHTLRGIHTDQKQVAAVAARLDREIQEHQQACIGLGLLRTGGTKKAPKLVRNTKLAKQWLEQIAGPGARRSEKTGDISLSADALAAADIPVGHPLDSYRRLGGTTTLRTKNIPPLEQPIVRTRYDELVASGRTSSSAPNLQNQPRKGGFRECLVAAPGHVFVISDWSGAELVTMAQVELDLFGSSALGDQLRAGINPHDQFACDMLGIELAELDKSIPEHADARQGAKAWQFGKRGGMGEARFIDYALKQYGFRVTPARHRELDALFHRRYPETRMFFKYVSALADHEGYCDIVQPRSGRIRGRLRFPDGCNTHFQGLAADAAGDCLWELWVAGLDSTSPLFGGLPVVRADGRVSDTGGVLFVHDENVTQVRREVADAALVEQERIMIEAFGRWCPDVPITVESHISERYGK